MSKYFGRIFTIAGDMMQGKKITVSRDSHQSFSQVIQTIRIEDDSSLLPFELRKT